MKFSRLALELGQVLSYLDAERNCSENAIGIFNSLGFG